MRVSQLARSIAESPTLAMNERARLLRERGEAVVHLGAGEPKNKAPLGAIVAAGAKLTSGEVKYAPSDGTPSLKQAIVRYTEENYGRVVAPENVIVSSGAKQALYTLLYTLLDPQDEVIVLAPYWVSYPEMVRMVYGVPVVVRPADGSFRPALADIEAVVGSRTRAIIVNSPNNPSGAVYDDTLLGGLVELCERRGIFLIADDIYHRLVFDGTSATPAYRFTTADVETSHVIVINGVSKLYGMTGFRIGWVVGPRVIVSAMTNAQSQIASCVSPVLQAAAEGALLGVQSVVESLRITLENNRNVMLQELASFNGVHVAKPAGTYYCLPDFRAYRSDSVGLAEFLLEKALVVTVPGREFGAEGHLRLSYAGTIKEITEGIARMKWALDPTAPSEIYIGDRRLVRDWT